MQESDQQQLFFMRWAIALGEKGRISAPPNPWVGCVIVKDGEIIGEGYHKAPGLEHAERIALKNAGPLAKGATVYISLEPCSHDGRTPPCVNALIEAGVKRVFFPLLDPDPKVSGRGMRKLKEAGVEVKIGIGKEEAIRSLKPYLHHRQTGRPFTVIKTAISLDGKTAAADGGSRWITGEEARRDVHFLRAQSGAILVGSRTALQDTPSLTVRGVEVEKQPLRILIDSKGEVPPKGPLADCNLAPTLLFTTSHAAKKDWESCGAEVIIKEKMILDEILIELGNRGVIQLLVEGGGRLHAAFMQQKLVNQVVVYLGNCLLGDRGVPMFPGFPGSEFSSIEKAPRWKLEHVARFGEDIRLCYDDCES